MLKLSELQQSLIANPDPSHRGSDFGVVWRSAAMRGCSGIALATLQILEQGLL